MPAMVYTILLFCTGAANAVGRLSPAAFAEALRVPA
jgi:hypothetical protein